jgi:hypothetical protein
MSTLISFALKAAAAPFHAITAGKPDVFTLLVGIGNALKIAQPFMAGSCVEPANQVP